MAMQYYSELMLFIIIYSPTFSACCNAMSRFMVIIIFDAAAMPSWAGSSQFVKQRNKMYCS